MSLTAAGFWISFFWLVIYAVKYSSRRPKAILPLSRHRRPATELSVKHFTLRLETDVGNVYHDQLCSRLSPEKSRILRQVLLRLYDLGSLVGVIGMVLGFYLLLLTVFSLSSGILLENRGDHHNATISKRRLDDAAYTIPSTAPASNVLRISPVIPGLTVPLSHLPLILVALAASQIVHEAGHVITAALHRIPMLSCGVAIAFLFPSAFVTLPAARLERLPPRDRLQIVSGGIDRFPIWIFFQDISALGRLVVGVDNDSPLVTHLPVGTLIVKLDDLSMASAPPKDPWDYYLLSPSPHFMKGWCADNSLLNEALTSVCTSDGPYDDRRRAEEANYSCFVSKPEETIQYGLDPVDIFTSNLTRCDSSVDCSSLASCVVPRRDQQLMRISVSRYDMGTNIQDIVVWKGAKEEIWEQVEVGNMRPRFPLVSSKLPKQVSTFFEYVKMANLSLYFINTLPIMALDGYQLLASLLQFLFGPASDILQTIDLENAMRSQREGGVQKACSTFFSFLALLLIALCGLLGIISWAKQ